MRGGGKQALRNQAHSDAMSAPVTNESQPTSGSCVPDSVLISLCTRERKKNYSSPAKAENSILELSYSDISTEHKEFFLELKSH